MADWLDIVGFFIDPRVAVINLVGGYLVLYVLLSRSHWWVTLGSAERFLFGGLFGTAYWFLIYTPVYAWLGILIGSIRYDISAPQYYLLLFLTFSVGVYSLMSIKRRYKDQPDIRPAIVGSLMSNSLPLYDFTVVLLSISIASSLYKTPEAMQLWFSLTGVVFSATVFWLWCLAIISPLMTEIYARPLKAFLIYNPWQRYVNLFATILHCRKWSSFADLLKRSVSNLKVVSWVLILLAVVLDARFLPLCTPRVTICQETYQQRKVTFVSRYSETDEILGQIPFERTYIIDRPYLGPISVDRVLVPLPTDYLPIEVVDPRTAQVNTVDKRLEISYPRGSFETAPFNVSIAYYRTVPLQNFLVSLLATGTRTLENKTEIATATYLLRNNTPLILRASMGRFLLAEKLPLTRLVRVMFGDEYGKRYLPEYSDFVKAYRVDGDRIFITWGELGPSQEIRITVEFTR